MKLSIVIPVYGCPNALHSLHERLTKTLLSITKSFEIIFVNDGCPKGSWDIVKDICKKDKRAKGINLSRNFGQHHATNAGIKYSTGDYVVLIDCDLQEKPEGIIDLWNKINEGYDVVFSKRINRKDSKLTIFLSKMFYKIYNYFVDGHYDDDIGNLSMAKRSVIDEYNKINDCNKVYTICLNWMGYKSAIIGIDGDERYDGKSSYSFNKKIDLAIDAITSHSNKPLKLLLKLGAIIAIIGFIYLLIEIISYFITKSVPEGWTSIIASIFLMGGIMLVCLGGVGIYVGNIFDQTKGKPEYIVEETINIK